MGEIRDRMASDLIMRRLRPKTQKHYLLHVKVFVRFHMRSPDLLGEADVRSFIDYLLTVRKVSSSTHNVYLAALRFLYNITLQRPEVMARIPRPRRTRKPDPAVLTPSEVLRILDLAPSPFARTMFAVAFGCGLRVTEVCQLQFGDIFGRDGLLVVRDGKGGKRRSTVLSELMYAELRAHFVRYRPPSPWLFPARPVGYPSVRGVPQWADHPVKKDTVSRWFRQAADNAGLREHVTFHTLRHSFATALQESGVPLNAIQVVLGHNDLSTTALYAHIRADSIRRIVSPMDRLLR